ncbi:hypothetical protein [Kaistella daneshvariae]|nr:hypothetical protein [Kaistella daneshvariae]
MKRKLGIFSIIILTILVIGFLAFLSNVSFFIIVREMPEESAKTVSDQVVQEIIPYFGIALLILISINYMIFKKLLLSKNSISKSIILSILTILISIIFLFGFKSKFIEQNKIDYQRILKMQKIKL